MESRAKLFGHPIHPMLIPFPLGLLATSLVFDIIHFLTGNEPWAEDAAFMKQQPGFISTQLHRGVAGSTTFVNVAVWESAAALAAAFSSPEFQEHAAHYPDSAVTQPHLFQKVAVPGICVA